jgi:cell filamentation protein
VADPYLFPGTDVLRNRLGIYDNGVLEIAERALGQQGLLRLKAQPLRLAIGVARLKATHKAIFGEIFEWAGEFRQNIGSMQKYRPRGYPVVYPPSTCIPQEMDRIFAALKLEDNLRGLSLDAFAARAAFFYGEMDGTHPFREGNSRTPRQFFSDVALGAGYALDWSAAGTDAAARDALYWARDEAAMQRRPEALAAIMRVGLRPLG